MYFEFYPDGKDGSVSNVSIRKIGASPSKWIANYGAPYIASVLEQYVDNENFGPPISGWAWFTFLSLSNEPFRPRRPRFRLSGRWAYAGELFLISPFC